MKRTYKSEAMAEAAKAKAVRFVRDVSGDEERASEIESESLSDWLEETHRKIQNSRSKIMPKTREDYLQQIRDLKTERDELADRVDSLESAFDQIGEIVSGDEDDEDDEDDE